MKLENALKEVEKLARTTAFGRFAAVPMPYIFAQYIQRVWFPITHRGVEAEAPTFFGHPLRMMLPSATDIYLTGGKTHDSEIRLAQFLLKTLQATSDKSQAISDKPQATSHEPQVTSDEFLATSRELEADSLKLEAKKANTFIDIGAHIGYFTALAAKLVGEKGQVVSVEAAKGTFQILSQNVENLPNVTAIHAAATAKNGELMTFYEFPVLYSEYNTMHVKQFENDRFFKKFKPEKVEVTGVTVDSLVKKFKLKNPVIKIDAEGAEVEVITGTAKTLREQSPTVIIEYLRDRNEGHKAAFALLIAANYAPFSIENGGTLKAVPSPADYFEQTGLDSDNFVFLKK
jgi:FkbM family methyltransferase